MDKPFDMLNFCQGQGRAGRDGQATKCYLLTPQSAGKPSSKETGVMAESKLAMYHHVFTYGLKRCLRYGTTLFTDGTGLACRQLPDNQLCCVCNESSDHKPENITIASMPKSRMVASGSANQPSSNTPAVPPFMVSTLDVPNKAFIQAAMKVKQMTSAVQLKHSAKADTMLAALSRLEDVCALCKILDLHSDEKQTHNLYCCPSLILHTNNSWDEYKEWRKGLHYVKWHNSICWLCHVPQLDDSLHPTFSKANKGKPDCQFADLVAPTAFAIYYHQALKTAAQQHFQQNWKTLDSFTSWLMAKPAVGSESNLIDLFMWYSITYENDE
ncbi:hypothetical protein EV363DRAFT_1447644 [Boletus edulis]|nr:hypothetical protein EV363DRAFT_1447644 [Boletus edulis]